MVFVDILICSYVPLKTSTTLTKWCSAFSCHPAQGLCVSSIIYPPSYQGLAAGSPSKHAAAYGAPMVTQHIPQAAVAAPPAMQIQQPYVPVSSNMLVSVIVSYHPLNHVLDQEGCALNKELTLSFHRIMLGRVPARVLS